MRMLHLALVLTVIAPPSTARAQEAPPPEHQHAGSEPPQTAWSWTSDANLFFGYNYQHRKFTDFSVWESQNWFMLTGQRRVGRGELTVDGMLSLEPFTLKALGSPQVFQTGEHYPGSRRVGSAWLRRISPDFTRRRVHAGLPARDLAARLGTSRGRRRPDRVPRSGEHARQLRRASLVSCVPALPSRDPHIDGARSLKMLLFLWGSVSACGPSEAPGSPTRQPRWGGPPEGSAATPFDRLGRGASESERQP